MPKVVKTTDVPTDPKRLYIYLYCDELGCYKSTTKKQAAKSWLSLSESKRRRFLKTCRLKKELNDTQRVLHTEPFLKQLHNSTVEDISSKNIKDADENVISLDNAGIEQNELCSLEQQSNKTCLDDNNEVQNETCLHEQQQNKSLIDDSEKQNKTCLYEQNNTNLDDDENEQQNETTLVDVTKEQNFVVAVVDESNNDSNDTDLQRNTEGHLDVNAICREINGSDTESLSNIDDQSNQGTNEDKTCANNSNKGLFINNIKEPIPPTVKNYKELFEILNKGKNITCLESDKHAYSVLLANIRREYIENYIEYLESLSDKQLQEHYHKECSKT